VTVQQINREHPDYMSFRPEKKSKELADQKDNANPTPSSEVSHAGMSQLEVVEVYKPTAHVNPIFVSVGADTSSYYSASEASDVVFRFLRIFICSFFFCLIVLFCSFSHMSPYPH
jgi:translation initiation factor 2D